MQMPLNDPAESRDLGFHFVALSSSRLLFRQPRIKAVQQQHLWPKQHINSTRMYSKYGTYRSRVRYPVYVIRTYYTVSFSYIVPGMYYSSEASFKLLHARKKKLTVFLSGCSVNLGFSGRSANRIRPKHGIPLPV